MYGEYNPLYNYDLHEQETQGSKDGGETGKDEQKNTQATWDGGIKVTEDPKNRKTHTKNYWNGYDDSTAQGSPDTQTEREEEGTVETTTEPKASATVVDMAGNGNLAGGGTFNTANQQHNTHDTDRTPRNNQALSKIAENSDDAQKYNRTNDRYLTRNGNIGVMTTESLIQEELELRKHDFLEEFVKRYINEYCFLSVDYNEGDYYGY